MKEKRKMQYTLVQVFMPKGWHNAKEDHYGLIPSAIPPELLKRIRDAGGTVFDTYAEAQEAANIYCWGHPNPENPGLPNVESKGSFNKKITVGGSPLFIPKQEPKSRKDTSWTKQKQGSKS